MTQPVYSEDIEVGSTTALGEHLVSLEEIKDYSERWDPQPFHTDESAAGSGYFGEPIASGLHSLAILQRLAVLGLFSGWAVLAGRRIREVGFLAPVRPGMVLTGSMTVDAVAHSSPERSLVTVTGALHHRDTRVLGAVHQLYVWRRPVG
ncbi:MaoC/PaaZ C-terminal domain-containing protein [Umezawaea endophytica]|uniref:MaoC/PaaZ C-terminal domain-containing protein n=1 Tax=Umezawaea endophytica TaxID=1654476 RepID=A0A9X3AFB5_9PSEU|nr:MaoC/PaaZ C-terminal domain-containing protein [Umezawaea endophytica]MCS7478036.1 MaoC/PaaZ C-terminal domain-containing protein [Umezawaea endophytica]